MGKSLLLLGWLLIPSLALCQIPSPESHFGFPMGADRRLVGWPSVVSYYQELADKSLAVRYEEIGRTT